MPFTYTSLKAALQTWPESASTEYLADIDTLIGLGETRVIRELNLEYFDVTDSALSVTSAANTVTKPSGIIVHRFFQIQVAGKWQPLEYRSAPYVRNHGDDSTATGIPRYIADDTETQWIVSPFANATYAIRCRFVKRPTGLTGSNATTWIGTNCGDLLLAACLMEAEQWLKADDRYGDLKSKYYEELLPAARMEIRDAIRNGDYQPFKPAAKSADS